MISLAQSIPEATKNLQNKGFTRSEKPKAVPVCPTIPDPEKLTATLSDKEKKILSYITYWLSTKGYCDSSIPQMASAVECGETTVERALARFKQLKLIYVTHRFNMSNFTYLNPYITQNYTWYMAFAKICAFLPRLVLSVSLLSSSQSIPGELSGRIKKFITPTPLLDGYPTVSSKGRKTDEALVDKGGVGDVDKKVGDMKQFDHVKGQKCTKIARALLKKGAKLTQDELLNLLAYDDSVLDRVSKAARETNNIRNLSSFFFGLLRKFSQEAGLVPDWETVQICRQCNIKLVSDEEIANPGLILAQYKPEGTPKTGTVEKPSYMEQVRQTQAEEKAAAQARAPKALSLLEKIKETEGTIAVLEATTGIGKQYADIILERCRRDLAELLAERDAASSPSAPSGFGAVKAEPAKPDPVPVTQAETKKFIQTLIEVDKLKAQEREKSPSRPQTPPAVQKSILEASSSSKSIDYDDVEEISDEEALYYQGKRDPFAEASDVSGADV